MRLKSLSYVLVIVMLLIAIAPAHGQEASAQVVVAPGDKIHIVAETDLTGPLAEFGLDIAQGAETAAALLNEAGGIKGWEVEMTVEDSACSGDQATTVANRVASDPTVVGVVGAICSGETIAASNVYEEARIVMVSPSATATEVTSRGLTVINRIPALDEVQGVVDARYIYYALGARKLALLHDNDTYGLGLAGFVRDEFTRLGGEVVAFEGIDTEAQDYRPVLTPFVALEPDVIFFGGYKQQAVLLIPQKNDVGLENETFFGADGIFGQSLIDDSGPASEGVYASFAPVQVYPDFDAKYKELFGIDPTVDFLGPYHYHAADAFGMIAAAIDQVSVVDDNGNLVIDREALIAAVRATTDYQGLTGVLTCSEIGDCGPTEFHIYEVQDGKFVDVPIPDEAKWTPPEMSGE